MPYSFIERNKKMSQEDLIDKVSNEPNAVKLLMAMFKDEDLPLKIIKWTLPRIDGNEKIIVSHWYGPIWYFQIENVSFRNTEDAIRLNFVFNIKTKRVLWFHKDLGLQTKVMSYVRSPRWKRALPRFLAPHCPFSIWDAVIDKSPKLTRKKLDVLHS